MTVRAILAIAFAALLCCLGAGCVSRRVTIPYVEMHYKPPLYGYQAIVQATINGVSGHFVIDTGAMGPMLTPSAVRLCGIKVMPSPGHVVGAAGGPVTMLQATNITVRFARGVAIHWPIVLVFPKSPPKTPGTKNTLFGFIDYASLRAHDAVIDIKHRTIALTR